MCVLCSLQRALERHSSPINCELTDRRRRGEDETTAGRRAYLAFGVCADQPDQVDHDSERDDKRGVTSPRIAQNHGPQGGRREGSGGRTHLFIIL